MNHFYISLRLSHWAKKHIAASRIIIVLGHVLLTIIAVFLSFMLRDFGISLGSTIQWFLISVYLIALFTYPSKNQKVTRYNIRQFYIRQKTCDLLLISTTFILIIQQGNQALIFRNIPLLNSFSSSTQAAVPVRILSTNLDSSEGLKESIKKNDLSEGAKKDVRKSLKLKLSSFIKKHRKNAEDDRLGWTILAVMGGIALLLLIAVLSCNLSCSGAEGAALLLGIGGGGLVIFLFIKLMIKFYRKKEGQKP
jgi:hypothetical protein